MARHLLALADFSGAELAALVDRALKLKRDSKDGVRNRDLEGRTVALVFEKPSTRTRVSFETAMYGLGGQVIYLSSRDTQLARNEPLKDMARVMSRYVDCLVIRTFGQEIVDELARYSQVPVINALTDLHHPCQILSDLMTVIEHKGALDKLKIAWVGDGNNMANSWIQAAARLGFALTLACPDGYEPDRDILTAARAEAARPINLVRDPVEAVAEADVINTDVWASMGQEDEQLLRLKAFRPYQVNDRLLRGAAPDAVVLHCLPAHRDEEISEAVLEGPRSVVWDQAENKMHIHKAILAEFIG
ncbi:ornithine carbamoyltransferase [Desulfurivibrio sp. C05AmB]|jgi:ornithine carbamoyltransferase|uniref:ornithine carbamoyltransferase n=1 Tax=Desulfurivibrio sp. C05AmB TaxID=3374371 RepID=UPI00376F1B0F